MTEEKTRRDFIFIATGAVGAIGVGGLAWPMIGSMNPAADNPHLGGPIVDLSKIEEGQQLKILFLGKPIFIRHRTSAEIQAAKNVDLTKLPHPETDNQRLRPNLDGDIDPRYLVMIGVCTHFGCIPVGEAGDFDGWYCPCHGAHFDTSGRLRKGPPPRNLDIPYYKYVSRTAIQLLPPERKALDEL